MERAISYINIMPDTKAGINRFVEKVLSEVEIREAIPLLVKLTAMSKIIEGVKSGLKDQIIDESSLYLEKTFDVDGVKITKNEGRKTYHYKHCEKWRRLNAEIGALEKMMQAGAPFADPETGEIIEPATVSYSEPFLTITLKEE